MALNAVIVEVEHTADMPEKDLMAEPRSTRSFSHSGKGKKVMEGEKPKQTSLPVDENSADPIDAIRVSSSTQQTAKETRVPPHSPGKHQSKFS